MRKKSVILTLAVAAAVALTGCLGGGNGDNVALAQTGSSTVLPLAQAWAEEFDGADVSVSGGGSSHGINSLLSKEADLGDASRKIKASDYQKVGCSVSADQLEAAQSGFQPFQYPACNGVTPTEWVVAFDALAVVVNPQNDWATELNYEQLRAIFMGGPGKAVYWDEVPGLEESAPHERIEIFAPDEASGTYEFFFEEIGGDDGPGNSRLATNDKAYHGSADDNVILRGIKNNENAVGFFGFAYYVENPDAVTAVAVAEGGGTDYVEPSFETVEEYPLTRPLHVYTDGVPPANGTAKEEALHGYLAYMVGDAGQSIVPEEGYVKVGDVNPETLRQQRAALN